MTETTHVVWLSGGKHFALGGLRSVCWAAGKANDWIDPHIFGLCDKRPELTLYPRNLRVGS